jgi:hypothetical protein
MFLLNFGLNRNDGKGEVDAMRLVRDLHYFGMSPVLLGTPKSDTEPTAVISVKHRPTGTMVDYLCDRYAQDCFAVYCPSTGTGELVGPKAAEWGEFNPAYFIVNGYGKRLSEALPS